MKYPDEVQISNNPLYGNYYIECYNDAGQFANTAELSYSAGADSIYSALVTACPWLRDKIDIVEGSTYSWRVDGLDW